MTGGSFQLFGALSKVEDQEDGTIKVYGVASSGAKDEAGETVLPDAMKAALPEYGRYPALREMHGLSAAGRTLEAEVGDDGVTRIVAHVVDPVAIAKVKSKTYAGFSIGGKVLGRDSADRTIITKLKLNEISLVDRPCNPEAAIDLWKADGALETDAMSTTEGGNITVATPTNDEVKAEAETMAKAAGKDGRWKDYVAKAREAMVAKAADTGESFVDDECLVIDALKALHPSAALASLLKVAADIVTAQPLAGAERDELIKAWTPETVVVVSEDGVQPDPVAALNAALEKATAAAQPAETVTPSPVTAGLEDTAKGLDEVGKAYEGNPLAKGLRGIASLSFAMYQLVAVQAECARECAEEGDASSVPDTIAAGIKTLGGALIAMAQEEVAELIADITEAGFEEEVFDYDVFAYAAKLVDLVKADTALMEKAGARNSKSDVAKIQSMHDNSVSLGATCGDSAKAAETEDLAKAATENERMAKALAEAVPQIEALTKRFEEQAQVSADLAKRLAQVESEPAAPRTAGSVRAITKAEDAAGAQAQQATVTKSDMDGYLAGLSEHDRAMLLTKAALQLPISG